MVVLSYHSLEDRITKQALADRARSNGPGRPPGRAARHRARRSGCSPGAPSCPGRRRSPRTREPPRCGCGPRNGSTRRRRSRGGPTANGTAAGSRRCTNRGRGRPGSARIRGRRPGTAEGRTKRGREHERQQARRPGRRRRAARTAVGGPDRGAAHHAAARHATADRTGSAGGDSRPGGARVPDPGQRRAAAGRAGRQASTATPPRLRVAPPPPVRGAAGAVRGADRGAGGRRGARHPGVNTKINENAFRLEQAAAAAGQARPGRAAAGAGDRRGRRRRATWPPRPASWAWSRPATPAYIRLPDGKMIGVPQPGRRARRRSPASSGNAGVAQVPPRSDEPRRDPHGLPARLVPGAAGAPDAAYRRAGRRRDLRRAGVHAAGADHPGERRGAGRRAGARRPAAYPARRAAPATRSGPALQVLDGGRGRAPRAPAGRETAAAGRGRRASRTVPAAAGPATTDDDDDGPRAPPAPAGARRAGRTGRRPSPARKPRAAARSWPTRAAGCGWAPCWRWRCSP